MASRSDETKGLGEIELLQTPSLPMTADAILKDFTHYFGRMLGRRTIRTRSPFLYQAVVYTARDRIIVRSVLDPTRSSDVGIPTFYELEPDPERPPVERARRAALPARGEVPLADGRGVVAVVAQDGEALPDGVPDDAVADGAVADGDTGKLASGGGEHIRYWDFGPAEPITGRVLDEAGEQAAAAPEAEPWVLSAADLPPI